MRRHRPSRDRRDNDEYEPAHPPSSSRLRKRRPAEVISKWLEDTASLRLEPESLLRMAAFFSLAREDLVIGGHMLDGMQTTRPYKAGEMRARCPRSLRETLFH